MKTLAGEMAALKERAIGIDLFGRTLDYDSNADPIVRRTAAEVRKKLAQYYQGSRRAVELRIELRPGCYVPEFHSPNVEYSHATRLLKLAIVVIGCLAIVAAPKVGLFAHWRASVVDRFWGPMFDAPGDVLFCLAQPRVYTFRSEARQKEVEMMVEGMSARALESSRELIPLSQLAPIVDRYIAFGDTTCLVQLASLFNTRGKAYRVLSEPAIELPDLLKQPAILIGAFDNQWPPPTIGKMRYTFDKDFQGLEWVSDRDHPEKTDWNLVNSWPNRKIPYDYAIVSRLFDPRTKHMVVVAAGITHFGTAGAGEFLSNPQDLAEAVPQLPHDWLQRNTQIVLRIPVVQGAAGHPQVLATNVW
jgi:hypothetical protein